MGRRVTSTTKGGRYMNPADQERKMARKKELKKNKKQRHMVRQAVLKSKDPEDLLEQMEKLDEMEFNTADKPPLSDRVIQEKRSKLRETFVRVMYMYRRENENDKFADMKKQLQNYDQKRTQLEQQYIAVKFANEVSPAEIPLPETAPPPPDSMAAMTPVAALLNRNLNPAAFPPHFTMPDLNFGQYNEFDRKMGSKSLGNIVGILKKPKKRSTQPPGPPVGLPPMLSDSEDEDWPPRRHDRPVIDEKTDLEALEEAGVSASHLSDDEDDSEEAELKRQSRVRFINANADEKDSRTMYKDMAKVLERRDVHTGQQRLEGFGEAESSALGQGMPQMPVGMMSGQRMVRPPFMPAMSGGRGAVRIPPPPMPNFAQSRIQRPSMYVGHVSAATSGVASVGAAILSAPPSITKAKPTGPIIEAKPQLRNMHHEVTKLVPTAVKVRRDGATTSAVASKKPKGPLIFKTPETKLTVPGSSVKHAPQKTADEAYDTFMQEMQQLL